MFKINLYQLLIVTTLLANKLWSAECKKNENSLHEIQYNKLQSHWFCVKDKPGQLTKRTFLLFAPGKSRFQPLPTVFALHGGGGKAKKFAKKTKFHEFSKERGFVTVYPQGFKKKWNSGHGGVQAAQSEINDVKFIKKLIKELTNKNLSKKGEIYATGHSNGAMMVFRLGAELSKLITKIAPVAGTIGGTTSKGPNNSFVDFRVGIPEKKVSLLAIHGKCDTSVTFDGKKGPTTAHYRTDLPAIEGLEHFANSYSCGNSTTAKKRNHEVLKYSYGCGKRKRKQIEVSLITHFKGHLWPDVSGGKTNEIMKHSKWSQKEIQSWGDERGCSMQDMGAVSSFNATQAILNFFFN